MKAREIRGEQEQCGYRAEISKLEIMARSERALRGWCPKHGMGDAMNGEGVFRRRDGEYYEGALITCKALIHPRISRRPPRPRGHIKFHAAQFNRYAMKVLS